MPGPELAQYGIGFFAVGGLIFIVARFLDKRYNEKVEKKNTGLAEVIKNNTRALEQVTSVVQAIQLSLTRQEAKIDELLDKARKQGG